MVRRTRNPATTSYVIRRDTHGGVMVMATNNITKEGGESIELIQQQRRNLWKEIQCVSRYASPTRAFRGTPGANTQKRSAPTEQSMNYEGLMAYEARHRESPAVPKSQDPDMVEASEEIEDHSSPDVAKEECRDDGDDNDRPKSIVVTVPREIPIRSDDITHYRRSFQSAEDHACCSPYTAYQEFPWGNMENTATRPELKKDDVPDEESPTKTSPFKASDTRRDRSFSTRKSKNKSKRRSVSSMRWRKRQGWNHN